MRENGMKSFSFHRNEEERLAEELRPTVGVAMGTPAGEPALTMLDTETVARRYLDEALTADALPALQRYDSAGQGREFRILGAEAVPLTGTTMVKFQQVSKGIPIYGSLVTVELDEDNRLLSLNTELGEPLGVSPIASVSPADAMRVVAGAKNSVSDGMRGVAGESVTSSQHPDPTPKLRFFFSDSGKWHLAYISRDVVMNGSRDAIDVADFVVDAHSGELLARLPRTQSVLASGGDELGNVRSFHFRQNGSSRELVDDEHKVHTHDFRFRDLRIEKSELPGEPISTPKEGAWPAAGVSAHANAVEVASFLRGVLKRDGVDNRGGPIIASINCRDGLGQEWRNAAWYGTQMVFGQRLEGGRLVSYAAALDIVAHEIVHGVTAHTARLEYSGESGALNESYSDILGIIASNIGNANVETWNWGMGEELDGSRVPMRNLSAPGDYGQPEHMRDYVETTADGGGVHTNSGIHNKAAYNLLVCKGADGRYVFDPRSVAALFYVSLSQYLSRTSDFGNSRRGVELAAQSLFRRDSARSREEKLRAVAKAFDSVGIKSKGVRYESAPVERPPAGVKVEREALPTPAKSEVHTLPMDPDLGGVEVVIVLRVQGADRPMTGVE